MFWNTILNFFLAFLDNTIVVVVVGALVAGWFGAKQYRTQKIWNDIDERYLKKGIEDLITHLAYMKNTIEENHAQSLTIASLFHDIYDEDTFDTWYKERKPPINVISPKIPHSFVITSSILGGNRHFEKLCLHIFSELPQMNGYYISTLMIILKDSCADPEWRKNRKEENQRIAEICLKQIEQKPKEINESGISEILTRLETILFILKEKNINSYKKLRKAYKDKKIETELKALEKIAIPEFERS